MTMRCHDSAKAMHHVIHVSAVAYPLPCSSCFAKGPYEERQKSLKSNSQLSTQRRQRGVQKHQASHVRHLRPSCCSSALILLASVALMSKASETASRPSARSFSRMIMSLVACVKRWHDREMLMAVSSLSPVKTHTCCTT